MGRMTEGSRAKNKIEKICLSSSYPSISFVLYGIMEKSQGSLCLDILHSLKGGLYDKFSSPHRR